MGWKPGSGLGKAEDGPLEPLLMDVKTNRSGLSTVGDAKISRREQHIIDG